MEVSQVCNCHSEEDGAEDSPPKTLSPMQYNISVLWGSLWESFQHDARRVVLWRVLAHHRGCIMSQLVVEPSSLQFPLTLNKEVVQLLFVSNRSSRRTVTFKVKTTSPRRYSVRPTRGVLWPGDQEQITITLRALRKTPSDADDCRDRFKVLSLP